MTTWLFLAAHPDDLEYFVGYFIVHLSSHKKPNDRIVVASMTRGEMSSFTFIMKSSKKAAIVRTYELNKSCEILGSEPPIFLGFFDGFVRMTQNTLNTLEKLFNDIKPDFIVAPEPIYTFYHHPDHIRTGKMAYFILQNMKKKGDSKIPRLYFFSSLKNDLYFPKMKKYKKNVNNALAAHASQSTLLITTKFINNIFGIISGRKVPNHCSAAAMRFQPLKNTEDKKIKLGLIRRMLYYAGKSLNSELDYSDKMHLVDGTISSNI